MNWRKGEKWKRSCVPNELARDAPFAEVRRTDRTREHAFGRLQGQVVAFLVRAR